jgi:hypothetical protein
VISLVAVFLSLGVGIFVGSNTNLFNIDTMIKKQNSIIDRLDARYKDQQKQVELDGARLKESQDYILQLEQKSIPLLMQGRLRGMSVGLVEVGDFASAANNDTAVVDVLNHADCVMAFKMRMPLASIEKISVTHRGSIADDLAIELLQGAAHSSDITGVLQGEGDLLAGDFSKPVQGIIFVLGENVNMDLASKFLVPIQKSLLGRDGVVVNVTFGKFKSYEDLFGETKIPILQDIETTSSQAELVNKLAKRLPAPVLDGGAKTIK